MLTHSSLGKVAFIGIGLIGGSLALALRRANIVDEILAIDASKAALAEALALGVIDRAVDWEDLSEADIIVLSTPVDALYTVCQSLAQISLKETVVITDVGSTKGSVLDAIRQPLAIFLIILSLRIQLRDEKKVALLLPMPPYSNAIRSFLRH